MMHQRVISFTLAILVAFSFTPVPLEAFVGKALSGMGHKLVKGTVNTATGFVEIPMQTYRGSRYGIREIKHPLLSHPSGIVLGAYRGVTHAAGRTLHGATDMAGFWAADPQGNTGYGAPLDAQYAWQGTSGPITLNPTEAVNSMGKKATRGLKETAFSFMEVPGQANQGIRKLNPFTLGVKGPWFGASRLYNGVRDVATFPLANPNETVGYHYDQREPWGGLKE
jgi:hypothetical protein